MPLYEVMYEVVVGAATAGVAAAAEYEGMSVEVVGSGANPGKGPKMLPVYPASTAGSITTTSSTTPFGSTTVSTTGTTASATGSTTGTGTGSGTATGIGGGGMGACRGLCLVFFFPFFIWVARPAPTAAARQQQKQHVRRTQCQSFMYKPQLPDASEPKLCPELEESLAHDPCSKEPEDPDESNDFQDAEDAPEPELALKSHGVIVVVVVNPGPTVVVYV